MRAFIYSARNAINNKHYIGSTLNKLGRIKSHILSLERGVHGNRHFQNAWNKYGQENFLWDFIEECDAKLRWIRELYWIEEKQSHLREFGYNLLLPHKSLAITSPYMSAVMKARWADLSEQERAERIAFLLPLAHASTRRKWKEDPEYRANLQRKREARWNDPVKRAAGVAQALTAIAIAHEQWNDPVRAAELRAIVLNNVSKAHRRWHEDMEYQERKRGWLKAASDKARQICIDDPEKRAVRDERLGRQAKAASLKAAEKMENDPEYRERFLARLRRQSAEISARRAEERRIRKLEPVPEKNQNIRAACRTPEYVEAARQRAKAQWAARKAQGKNGPLGEE
jgi:group I intron endonuclease